MDVTHILLYGAAGLSVAALGVMAWDLHTTPTSVAEAQEYTPKSVATLVLFLTAFGMYLTAYVTNKEECLQFATPIAVWTLSWVGAFFLVVGSLALRSGRRRQSRSQQ